MGNPDAISVDSDEVLEHAKTVKQLMGSLDMSLEAATYLGNADDGYGAIPRPFVKMVLEDNHRNAIEVIRKLAEDVAVLPDKLRIVAETFQDQDGSFGKSLDELRETIAAANGGQK
ncbi:type VII secretion target [Nocardia bhagyanarayanae]|uniref:Excreted virulence factor EspC (Type VII ESX diderm) n=1 Tax=Nocardia bhagyanarayanae TaxID=1215925 RepID=A0A543EWA8_9NOCA|nr:hypothetical protein [Nocardia bhagyanarayanae]TQM25880.1 hypothetical protein FB390_6048 [Nocardia bhagyanarayanae]